MKIKNYQELEKLITSNIDMSTVTSIEVEDYVNSKGDVRDIRAHLMEPGGYKKLIEEDAAILERLDEADLVDAFPDESLSDLLEALKQLQESKNKYLYSDKEESRSSGNMRRISNNVSVSDVESDCIYFTNLRVAIDKPSSLPKSDIPRLKKLIGYKFKLPSLGYLAVIKLAEGKFSSCVLRQ